MRDQSFGFLKKTLLATAGLVLGFTLLLLFPALVPLPDAYRNPPCWRCPTYGAEGRGLPLTEAGPLAEERQDPGTTTAIERISRSDRYPSPTKEIEGVPVPLPSQKIHEAALAGSSVLYSLEAVIDAHSRRVSSYSGKDEHHLLVLGCSFAFGTGVEDHETLPSRLGKTLPRHRPYNMGFGGYGPTSLYVRTLSDEAFSGIEQDQGIALYYWINDHMMRTLGSYALSKRWGSVLPRVTEGPDGLELQGSHGTLGLGALFPYFESLSRLGLSWPLFYTAGDLELAARILAGIGENYRKKFPRGKFFVVLAPHLHQLNQNYDLRPALDKAGVPYLDYTNREIRDYVGLPYIPGDGHPSPAYYEKVAEWIARDLERNGLARVSARSSAPRR